MIAVVALVLGLVSSSYAAGKLNFTDCNTSPNKVLRFDHAHLTSDPVHIPGNETGSIDVHVLRPIAGNNFQLNITVQKKILFGYVTVPCVKGVGSCSYNFCDLLSGQHYDGVHHCPLEIKQTSPDFQCACPFQPGDYHLNPTTFHIPKLNALYGWLSLGDFHVHAILTDTTTGEEVMCYDVYLSIVTDCKEASCIFGTSPNKVLHVDHALLSADPVHIPGPETGSIDVHVLQPIDGLHHQFDVKIQKKLGILGYTTIPCVNNFGTCTYQLCDLLSGKTFDGVHHCPLQIKQSSPDFNCACPFQTGDYHLNKTTFQIPELSGFLSWLAGGDYQVHLRLTDTNTKEQVGCYDISVSTETDCSGLSCLFG